MKPHKIFQVLFLILSCTFIFQIQNGYSKQADSEIISLDNVAPDKINSVLAKLSDEQIRVLLISELAKDLEKDPRQRKTPSGLVGKTAKWLHILDDENTQTKNQAVFSHV